MKPHEALGRGHMTLDVRPIDLEIVVSVLARNLPSDAEIYAFGSRVTGGAGRGSDLDLAVDVRRAMTIAEIAALETEYAESFLPYVVDIVDLHGVDAVFREDILRRGLRLSIDPTGF